MKAQTLAAGQANESRFEYKNKVTREQEHNCKHVRGRESDRDREIERKT